MAIGVRIIEGFVVLRQLVTWICVLGLIRGIDLEEKGFGDEMVV